MKKLFIFSILIFSFLVFVITTRITLSKTGDRNYSYDISKELEQRINKDTAYFDNYDSGKDLCKIALDDSLKLTAELLEFSEHFFFLLFVFSRDFP